MSLGAILMLAAAGGPALVAGDAGQGVMTQTQASASVEIVQAERISFAAMGGAAIDRRASGAAYQLRTDGVRIMFEFN